MWSIEVELFREKIYGTLSEEYQRFPGSIRTSVSRAHLIPPSCSLHRAFTDEEEEALADVCVMYARQGTPFTVPHFIQIASYFAGRYKKEEFFSEFFARSFIKRHEEVLCYQDGILTSPTRMSDKMLQMTDEFNTMMNTAMKTNRMNKNNIVVFDETIIGDSVKLQKVIGERRDSDGGNIHVVLTREYALGCYIPFSMVDGSTPFRVFILKVRRRDICEGYVESWAPDEEIGLRGQLYRLFFASETGCLTIEIFKCIMEKYAKWWATVNPGLACYMISDNLSIHRNREVVKIAKDNGIELLNIMPGSSHWFQVHDQLPFAVLKKKLADLKNEFLAWIPPSREERRALFMALFFKAETIAFRSDIVQESFEEVGLWPWNPEKILQAAREHSPTFPKAKMNRLVREVLRKVKEVDEKKRAEVDECLNSLKRVRAPFMEKDEMKNAREEEVQEDMVDECQEDSAPSNVDSRSVPIEPPAKRKHTLTTACKRCGAKGCQKTHFWSKKWISCPKCKINFCPLHAHLMRNHTC